METIITTAKTQKLNFGTEFPIPSHLFKSPPVMHSSRYKTTVKAHPRDKN